MADYPTPSQYQEALQVPEAAFGDPDLQSATPRTNALGLPQPITGAFAAVFPMTTDADVPVAAKCFLKEQPRQQARYDAIAAHLSDMDLDALVAFDYQAEGVRVDGTAYPLLKMEWAEGMALNRFVEAHLDEPSLLARLADAWADLMAQLEDGALAHGDLQHGNVLVQATNDDLRLRLVDYDTMYVPALEGWTSAEVGHRNYQHPDRTDADFGASLDRFSGLVIYTALRACVHRPGLWDRFDTGENLLFRDADFYAPEESPLFDALGEIEALAGEVEALRTACYVEPPAVPSLHDVRAGRGTPGSVPSGRPRRRTAQRRPRSPFARTFLPALLSVLAGAVGLAVAGLPTAGGLVAAVGLGGGAGLAMRRYQTRSLMRRRRRLEQEAARFSEAIRGLRRELEKLKEQRADVLNSMDARRAERLAEVQEEALHDRLKHHFIGEVRAVDGIIHKHVVRLKAANIRTASEATPEALDAVRRISDEARTRIKMWRAALTEQYADAVPDALSPAQERRLRRYVEHRVDDIDAQLARTREKIEVQKNERERVRDRLNEMPTVTPLRYLRYLCGLGTLPDPHAAPAPPAPRDPDPVPQPTGTDGPWWGTSPS
ncbi:MAG: hypothetical protein R6T83_12805 [Salinibacter sp.]